jgi:hypothetical protein
MVTDGSVRVERVGRAAQAKIVQASIPKALRRFVRFTRVKTLKPGSAAAVWAGCRPPRETLTPAPTWTGPPVAVAPAPFFLPRKDPRTVKPRTGRHDTPGRAAAGLLNLFSLGQRLDDLAGAVDEKPGQWTKRAVFHHDDTDGCSLIR